MEVVLIWTFCPTKVPPKMVAVLEAKVNCGNKEKFCELKTRTARAHSTHSLTLKNQKMKSCSSPKTEASVLPETAYPNSQKPSVPAKMSIYFYNYTK